MHYFWLNSGSSSVISDAFSPFPPSFIHLKVKISLVSFCDQETKPRSHPPQLVSSIAPFWSQLIFILLKTWLPKTSSSRKQAWTLLSGFYEVWIHLNVWPKDCSYWSHQWEAWLNLTNSLVYLSHCFQWSFLCSKTELVFTCPFWHKQTFLHGFKSQVVLETSITVIQLLSTKPILNEQTFVLYTKWYRRSR